MVMEGTSGDRLVVVVVLLVLLGPVFPLLPIPAP
jgi:hypothetical protein